MLNPKWKIVLYLFLLYFLEAINAECTVHVEGYPPLFSKIIGKKIFKIPSDGINQITLKIGETINVHCLNTIFMRSNNYYDINEGRALSNVILKCSEEPHYNQIIYDNFDAPGYIRKSISSSDIYVKCIQGSQKLHDSNETLPSCQNYTSLGIGTQFKYDNLAVIGICFDFETLTTKYVKYLAYRPKFVFLDQNTLNNEGNRLTTPILKLNKPVDNFDILFEDSSQINFNISYEEKKLKNPLLKAHEFELLSLIQDTNLSADIEDFKYLFNIVWWRNLRLGSWNIFLEALKKQTETVKYIVYTGTSRNLMIPPSMNCKIHENGVLNLFASETKYFKIPKIIWMYLKSINTNNSEEFVIFGYNTPFYSTAIDTIRCEDICKEISWLYDGDFGKIHLLPAFGVVHCCRPEDIAFQLDVFPVEEIVLKTETAPVPAKEEIYSYEDSLT